MLRQLQTDGRLGTGLLAVLILGMIVSFATADIAIMDQDGVDVTPQKFAVLIGIDRYQNLPNLQYCGSDTTALKKTLLAGGFREKNIFLMTDDAERINLLPTGENIRRILATLEEHARANDMIFFFFSGHSGTIDGVPTLMASDSVGTKDDQLTGLKVQEILDTLGRCQAKTRLVVIDSCLDDQIGSNPGDKSNELTLPNNTALFLAAKPGFRAYESPELQGSWFTHYIIRGLQGQADNNGDENGIVDLTELFHYVKTQLAGVKEFKMAPWLIVNGNLFDLGIVHCTYNEGKRCCHPYIRH